MNATRQCSSKRKTKKKAKTSSSLAVLFSPGGRRMLAAGFLICGLVAATIVGWKYFGGKITAQPDYIIQEKDIQTTPAPEWVKADIRNQVFSKEPMENLSVLDRQLTVKIAHAFADHPWVARVVRVSKYFPAQVVVDLNFREPVAMVEVLIDGEAGLLPIDKDAVLLPTEGFTEADTRKYVRIAVADAFPTCDAGETWKDQRVEGAVQVANLLKDHWQKIGIYRIVATIANNPSVGRRPSLELQARNGSRVFWGAAPKADDPIQTKEAAILAKKLVEYAQTNGSLDLLAHPVDIDLRGGVMVTPRTADRNRDAVQR